MNFTYNSFALGKGKGVTNNKGQLLIPQKHKDTCYSKERWKQGLRRMSRGPFFFCLLHFLLGTLSPDIQLNTPILSTTLL